MQYDSSKSIFPILDEIFANPACCECGSFPSSIFTFTEKLQLIREGYALFPSDEDKEIFDDQLRDFIHEYIGALGRLELCILDDFGKDKEQPLEFPTWYEQEIYESLFSRDDWYELLQKVDDYTAQVNNDNE